MPQNIEDRRKAAHCRRLAAQAHDPRISEELLAYASELERGESFTTLELKINFMKPVWRAHLRAEGKVVRRGRTVGLVECDVFDEKGSLVARASSTCLTLRGEMAKGR